VNKKPETSKDAADKLVKNIRRKTRQTYSAAKRIRSVLAGLRGEESLSVLCRRAGIAKSLYFSWSKEFLEAGKRRLSGDTARQASSSEVKELRSEALALKKCGADLTLKTACSRKEDRSLSVMQRITCRVTAGGDRHEILGIREVGEPSHARRVASALQKDA